MNKSLTSVVCVSLEVTKNKSYCIKQKQTGGVKKKNIIWYRVQFFSLTVNVIIHRYSVRNVLNVRKNKKKMKSLTRSYSISARCRCEKRNRRKVITPTKRVCGSLVYFDFMPYTALACRSDTYIYTYIHT